MQPLEQQQHERDEAPLRRDPDDGDNNNKTKKSRLHAHLQADWSGKGEELDEGVSNRKEKKESEEKSIDTQLPKQLQQNKKIMLEICIDSVHSAREAKDGGAERVELCSNLVEGGTTPSAGLIQQVVALLRPHHIPVHVLIRPRGGDFCYTEEELAVIEQDVAFCKQCGVSGVVVGTLTSEGTIDEARMRKIVQLARPMLVVFHRAFDMVAQPFIGLYYLT